MDQTDATKRDARNGHVRQCRVARDQAEEDLTALRRRLAATQAAREMHQGRTTAFLSGQDDVSMRLGRLQTLPHVKLAAALAEQLFTDANNWVFHAASESMTAMTAAYWDEIDRLQRAVSDKQVEIADIEEQLTVALRRLADMGRS